MSAVVRDVSDWLASYAVSDTETEEDGPHQSAGAGLGDPVDRRMVSFSCHRCHRNKNVELVEQVVTAGPATKNDADEDHVVAAATASGSDKKVKLKQQISALLHLLDEDSDDHVFSDSGGLCASPTLQRTAWCNHGFVVSNMFFGDCDYEQHLRSGKVTATKNVDSDCCIHGPFCLSCAEALCRLTLPFCPLCKELVNPRKTFGADMVARVAAAAELERASYRNGKNGLRGRWSRASASANECSWAGTIFGPLWGVLRFACLLVSGFMAAEVLGLRGRRLLPRRWRREKNSVDVIVFARMAHGIATLAVVVVLCHTLSRLFFDPDQDFDVGSMVRDWCFPYSDEQLSNLANYGYHPVQRDAASGDVVLHPRWRKRRSLLVVLMATALQYVLRPCAYCAAWCAIWRLCALIVRRFVRGLLCLLAEASPSAVLEEGSDIGAHQKNRKKLE